MDNICSATIIISNAADSAIADLSERHYKEES